MGGGSGCGRWRGPVTDLTGPLSGSPGMRRGRESWWKLFSTGYGQESTRGINGPGLIRGWEAAQFCGIAGPTRGRCCRVQGRGAVSLLFRHGRQCFCFCFCFCSVFCNLKHVAPIILQRTRGSQPPESPPTPLSAKDGGLPTQELAQGIG